MISIGFALIIGTLLAFANGANDISKGIATLVGSGVSRYQRALMWGMAWTAVGAGLAAFSASAMLATFGKGLINPGVVPSLAAALATLGGAAFWVLIATRTGLPVSTTHALVGALVGVALVAYGSNAIEWRAVASKVLMPLIISPIAAFIFTYFLLMMLKPKNSQQPMSTCICIEENISTSEVELSTTCLKTEMLENYSGPLSLSLGEQASCAENQPNAVRITLDQLHWLSSGATSLARGMNDAPKIVALIAAATLSNSYTFSVPLLFLLVGVGMLLGCFIGGKRVTQVLATKITKMDHYEGFAANLVTATLISVGAIYGLPMSTTHVSSGGIFSAGYKRGTLDKKVLRDILLAWLITLPVSAIAGTMIYFVLKQVMY